MKTLNNYLKIQQINLERLLLDPKNPRFNKPLNVVREDKYAESKIQDRVLEKISNEFGIEELKKSILEIGFLPVDRIVVTPIRIREEEYFIVIEGNRRIAALKSIIEEYEAGERELDENFIESLKKIEVLIFEPHVDLSKEQAQLLIQGIRHISGIKEWGPYQQALALESLINTGLTFTSAADALGIKPRQAAALMRALYGIRKMEEDEEFGEEANPEKFSYFVELFKKPALRDWVGWDDNSKTFNNIPNLKLFFEWIVQNEDGVVKIPKAIDVRRLPEIISNDTLYEKFRNESKLTIDDAITLIKPSISVNWEEELDRVIKTLRNIPALRKEELLPKLKEIQKIIVSLIGNE